jgi:transcription antitermination factor NusG
MKKTAEASLRAAGYGVYVPRYKVRMRDRSRHRKMIVVVRPLFGAYVFVQFDPHIEPWSRLATLRGVRSLVKLGAAMTVPAAAIEALRCKEAENFGRALSPRPQFLLGQAVRITVGPFTGIDGIIEAVLTGTIDGETGIVALANLFGRTVRISGLSAEDVATVEKAPRPCRACAQPKRTSHAAAPGPSSTKTERGGGGARENSS